ncbi:hypothetical protein MARA_16410 [Mycolicibacterium arabiense]|uniref:Uncharacterized protein n=1 Tax=Mycolicibacterium arabiense TaxID=1286181 RepID=A0A7I7RUG1_9MYCO|nr:hypothetical protein [Mycolicibacterium arabiense]MCV7373543.1 hypothetical protein [Mycolicibacterium arabiense]BBY48173.1 hypothetical protein MARA_16410 [Mycolicibacterium arabiense]
MLSAIAVIPSAPVMVTELAAGAAEELTDLRTAVLGAAAALPDRWVVIGAGRDAEAIGPESVGTFAGYGVDVRVALAPGAESAPRALPLCALIAGWVRGCANPAATVEVRVFADDLEPDAAAAAGRALRAEIDAMAADVGVLVVADGANTLTPTAPGGYDPASLPGQEALDDALATGDVTALARLGRVAHQVLAGLAGPRPVAAQERYRGAPYGVGYFVGTWTPAGRSAATGGETPA